MAKTSQQSTLTIGQLAQRTGLAITAIRFYEEQELVFPTRNSCLLYTSPSPRDS